jgi:integrase
MASIDRRPDGQWRARWREFPGGPQRAKHFDRKLDAERHLIDVQHRLLSGTYVDPTSARVTLNAYAEIHLARQPWRVNTAAAATRSLAHARRVLGERPLGSIRKGDVQALISGLDMKPSTAGLVFQHVNALLEAAADDGLIPRNPARGVKLPASTTGEVVPPTVEQVAVLCENAEEWFRPAVVLGAGLGLRQAEASGLTVDRVLWLERAVRIDRQWITSRGRAEFGPPKTKSSNRTIPASQWVLDALGAHVGRRHDGFVLERDGEPVRSRVFNYQWSRTVSRAGLSGIKFHAMRHAYASMLISAGCSVKAVQHALGHASAATTLDLYAHLWPGDEDRIRDAVDQAWTPRTEDQLRIGGVVPEA